MYCKKSYLPIFSDAVRRSSLGDSLRGLIYPPPDGLTIMGILQTDVFRNVVDVNCSLGLAGVFELDSDGI